MRARNTVVATVLAIWLISHSWADEPLKCEAGPVTRTFGGTPWLIYGCQDGQSLAIVSAPGNPAMPFYFFFSPSNNGHRLVGEGTGSKQASAAALTELNALSAADVIALGVEARRAKAGSSP